MPEPAIAPPTAVLRTNRRRESVGVCVAVSPPVPRSPLIPASYRHRTGGT